MSKKIGVWVSRIAGIVVIGGAVLGLFRYAQLEAAYEQLKAAYEQLLNERDQLRTAYRELTVQMIMNCRTDSNELKGLMESLLPTQEFQAIEERTQSEPIVIPLTAGWRAQGPGAKGSGYQNGVLELKADLNGGDAYAELFLDLRSVRLPNEVPRNPDGTYDLAGKELVAVVSSDYDFKGASSRPNGAQILLKSGPPQWANLVSPWLHIHDTMQTPQGMEIFFAIPDDAISKEVAGISLKFTIGTGSSDTYEGSFFVKSVKLINRSE